MTPEWPSGAWHALEWGKIVGASALPIADDWRKWPRPARKSVAAAMDRGLAVLRDRLGSSGKVLSDYSEAVLRDDGRWHLYRRLIVEK